MMHSLAKPTGHFSASANVDFRFEEASNTAQAAAAGAHMAPGRGLSHAIMIYDVGTVGDHFADLH